MAIVNMNAIKTTGFYNNPYKYALIDNILNNSISAHVSNEYPQNGYEHCETLHKDKTYSMDMKQLYDSRILKKSPTRDLSPNWKILIGELLSDEYISIMSMHAQTNLKKCGIEINCWQYSNGCWLSPHTDKPEKIISQLFYFNDHWEKSWGGGFRILNSDKNEDISAEIFPSTGQSIILPRCSNSWHSVAKLTCPPEVRRKLLQIIFWRKTE